MAPKTAAKTSKFRQLIVAILALLILFIGVMAIYRNFTREDKPGVKPVGAAQKPEELQEAWSQDWLGVLQGVTALVENVKDEASAKNIGHCLPPSG